MPERSARRREELEAFQESLYLAYLVIELEELRRNARRRPVGELARSSIARRPEGCAEVTEAGAFQEARRHRERRESARRGRRSVAEREVSEVAVRNSRREPGDDVVQHVSPGKELPERKLLERRRPLLEALPGEEVVGEEAVKVG